MKFAGDKYAFSKRIKKLDPAAFSSFKPILKLVEEKLMMAMPAKSDAIEAHSY